MKTTKKLLALLLALVLCLSVLAGCSSSDTTTSDGDDTGIITVANSPDEVEADTSDLTPLGEASDFTFDFETLDYSFTGVAEAEFYYIKVYPVVDGEESNSASFQSDKIDANDSNSYSGTVEDENLLAGDYIAHVVASASGYESSDIQTSGTSTLLATPTVTASWNTGTEEDATVTADITITPGDSLTTSFTLTVTDEGGAQVYSNTEAGTETINLTAADLGADTLTVEDVYNVTVTVNPVDGYTAPSEGVTAQITEAMGFGF